MAFGLPYRGSKSSIAQELIAQLPSAPVLIDAFGGGGAITQAAASSGKFGKIIYNDIYSDAVQTFANAVKGAYKNRFEWVSRDEFFASTELFTKLCWSFSNEQRGYIYGEAIEPIKHAVWNLWQLQDSSLCQQLQLPVIEVNRSMNMKAQRLEFQRAYSENYGKKLQLESAIQIERINKLIGFDDSSIIYSSKDYQELEIPEGAVIYCDIPYLDSTEESYGGYSRHAFEHEKFYAWARKQKNIFISEYTMPFDFKPIWAKEKVSRARVNGALIKVEKLFTI